MRVRSLLVITLAIIVTPPVLALDNSYLKRGSPERQGRAWVERSECGAPVRDGGRLVLRADFGSVVVRTGTSGQMGCQVVLRAYTPNEAEARRQFSRYDLSLRTLEGGAYLSGKSAGDHWRAVSMSAEFNVQVPKRFNLDIQTQGGDVTLQEVLEGDVRATTAGGGIRAADVSGAVRVETAGGSITLANIGRHLEARTAGGNIRVGDVKGNAVLETSGGEIAVGHVDGTLRAVTAGGDVVIGGARGAVVAETAGGQITIGPAGSSVRAETAGGSIRLNGARGRVVVETAGGSIDLFQIQGAIKASNAAGRILAQISASRNTFGASQLDTSMGDVQVFLPPDLPLNIDAAIEMAAGHRILSDFPIDIRGEREEFVPRQIRGSGALNGGGELLRIRTVNGNIEIRKLDARTLEELKGRQEDEANRAEARRLLREQRRREREHERLKHLPE